MNNLNKLRDFLYGTLLGNLIVFIIVLAFLFCLIFLTKKYGTPPSEADSSLSDSSDSLNENCSVIGINLHGDLLTYIPEHAENDSFFNYDVVGSENIIWAIDKANADENVKAIIVEVDSSGGLPVAGEEISNAIKNSEKPIVAFIRRVGASASYLAISSADKIFASKYSDVGSIGVTMSYLNNVAKNKKDGYTFEQLSAGKFKDAGSSDLPLTKEERDLFMRDINIIYEDFIKEVSVNRNIPIEKVRKFADGSTVLGEKAKELGMIDEIGGLPEVESYLEGVIGEKPEICWE